MLNAEDKSDNDMSPSYDDTKWKKEEMLTHINVFSHKNGDAIEMPNLRRKKNLKL